MFPSTKGYIGREVPYLKTVCWIWIPIISQKFIATGFKYRLHLLHGLMSYNTVVNKMNFKILIAMPNENEYTTVYESSYLTSEMA